MWERGLDDRSEEKRDADALQVHLQVQASRMAMGNSCWSSRVRSE